MGPSGRTNGTQTQRLRPNETGLNWRYTRSIPVSATKNFSRIINFQFSELARAGTNFGLIALDAPLLIAAGTLPISGLLRGPDQ